MRILVVGAGSTGANCRRRGFEEVVNKKLVNTDPVGTHPFGEPDHLRKG